MGVDVVPAFNARELRSQATRGQPAATRRRPVLQAKEVLASLPAPRQMTGRKTGCGGDFERAQVDGWGGAGTPVQGPDWEISPWH